MQSASLTTCIAILAMGWHCAAQAEKADRTKPMTITAQGGTLDAVNDVQKLDGRITIEQGTLRITASKGETRRDAEGNFSGFVTGSPVTVKQKREGCDAWIEGEAERVEFDQSKDTIKLKTKARIRTGDNELSGDQMLYNTVSEVFQLEGSNKTGELITMVAQPRAAGKDPCAKKTGAETKAGK